MKRKFELYSAQKILTEAIAAPSEKMIKTLKDCLQMEISYPGKPYGPADIGGSFFGLYKRGFLDIHINSENRLRPGNWYVTTDGLHFLLSLPDKQATPGDNVLFKNMDKLKQNVINLHKSMYNLKLTSEHIVTK